MVYFDLVSEYGSDLTISIEILLESIKTFRNNDKNNIQFSISSQKIRKT